MDASTSPQPQPSEAPPASPSAQGKKGGSKTLIIVGVVVVVLLLIGAVAAYFVMNAVKDEVEETVAEEFTEGLLESSTGGDVDVEIDEDNETYTWETDEGSATIGSAMEWPDAIPSDVPEFTYGEIESQFALEEDGRGGWNLGFSDADSGAADLYQSDLESDGWDVVSTMSSGSVEMFTAEKDIYTVSCSCNTEDDTCVVIVYTD